LFDASNYRLYIVPVISRIFPVRDAQIRLVLLHYFPHYVTLMDPDHLVHNILPEVNILKKKNSPVSGDDPAVGFS
jgi:SCY1-like protein 3